ncbi:MAG: DUF2784 domain-containing protein [Spirochaetales bacterium]|nr:DUF2784 domain-containing protein [Spirochaetales bacterium]
MEKYLPDLILILHFLYFLFCVAGEVCILVVAVWERWRSQQSANRSPAKNSRAYCWIQNRTFRVLHLIAVGIVGLESLFGVLCPLTVWEYRTRRASGQGVEEEIPLLSRIIRSLLFYDFPPWVFTALYVGFSILVIGTFILIPPQKKQKTA